MKRSGFTLVEVLIYVAIFSVLAMVFSSILLTYYRVDKEQMSRSEISSQLNFTLQTIQNMIGQSGTAVVRDVIDIGDDWDEVDSAVGESQNYLVLKAKSEGNQSADVNSPIIIYADAGVIKVKKGRGVEQTETVLTTDRVTVDNLSFRKLINYPSREIIEIDLTMSYNDPNLGSQVSRQLISGIGKAEAAVFDTSLLPGSGGSIDIGQSTQRWRDGYFSNNLLVDNQTNTESLIVGDETVINGLRTGFLTINPPAVAADSNGTFRISSSNIGASDRIFFTPPYNLESGLVLVGARTIDASNEIEITLRNTTESNINGSSRDWAYLLIK